MSTILSKEFAFGQLEGAKQFLNQLNLNKKLWFITKGNVAKATGASIAGLILIYLGKIWYSYRFFKKRGIKTPRIEFFFGNYRQLGSKNFSDSLRDWTNELGKTYGYFEGHSPVLVTSDLDVIQEIFIKQYSNFTSRKIGPIAAREGDPNHNLFSSSRSRWKRMRNVMNPTFSSAKLRELSPLMIKCVDRLNNKLELSKSHEINVSDYLKRFTLDTIWNCAFGVDINFLFDKSKDEYYEKCEAIFQRAADKHIFVYLGTYFHESKYFILDLMIMINRIYSKIIGTVSVNPFVWLREKVIEIVEKRNRDKVSRKDYLQLLLDAQTSEKIHDADNNLDYSNSHLDKKLTVNEIKMNLVLFMLAGYETTSTTLSYATYILAKYPEEQEKLHDEIVSIFPNDVEPEIDTIQKLVYTDMFIREVLRMYPIANTVVNRQCTRATKIKGIEIPVGTDIALDVLSLHYDPELWGPVDPNQFYPSRFAPEHKRNPLAFAAFGLGPRNCIGMKFALQELKFALVKLLKKYEVVAGPNFPNKLEIKEGAVRSPKYGVPVVFKPRENSD